MSDAGRPSDLAYLFDDDRWVDDQPPADPVDDHPRPLLSAAQAVVLMLSIAVVVATFLGWVAHQVQPEPQKPATHTTTGDPR